MVERTIRTIIITIISVFLAIPIIIVLSFLLVSFSEPNPPEPEIEYAEFPFELVYEINGETKTVKDVYVCEYEGISVHVGVSKARQWTGYVKNATYDDCLIILVQDGEIYAICSIGLPGYYMGDPEYKEYDGTNIKISYIKNPNEMGFSVPSSEEVERLLEKYQLKIISWEIADPIENEFKVKETNPIVKNVLIGCVMAAELLFIVIVIVWFIKKGKCLKNN